MEGGVPQGEPALSGRFLTKTFLLPLFNQQVLANRITQVDVKTAFTSHSYRGLWEVRWVPAN